MKKIRLVIFVLIGTAVVLSQVGCGGEVAHDHGHSHAGGEDHHHEPHYHEPPHGGAGVTLGNEDAQLVKIQNKVVDSKN